MKSTEVLTVHRALQGLIGTDCPEKLMLTLNLKILGKIATEIHEVASDLYDQFADKDEEGKVKYYEREVTVDKIGNKEMGKEKRISDLKKYAEYMVESKKLDVRDWKISLQRVTKAKMEKFMNAKSTDGNLVLPLLDVIIVDSIDEPKQTKEKA